MQYSGLFFVSALSTGAALWNVPRHFKSEATAPVDRPSIVPATQDLASDDNVTQCSFDNAAYLQEGACQLPSLVELESEVGDAQWQAVKQWAARAPTASDSASTELFIAKPAEADVRAVEFLEQAPTVACITVLPMGRTSRIQRIIDGFLQQTYEGSMQLIIVANDDDETRQALNELVDGVTIKALFTDVDRTDVASLYRAGASQAADADVLARWDWNARHHRQRLSLQIRAMALTGRPASHLRSWTAASRDESLGEPSLVGDSAWMQKFWYPRKNEDALQTANSRHLVELDMPNLLGYPSKP